jgi:hypothetical protein
MLFFFPKCAMLKDASTTTDSIQKIGKPSRHNETGKKKKRQAREASLQKHVRGADRTATVADRRRVRTAIEQYGRRSMAMSQTFVVMLPVRSPTASPHAVQPASHEAWVPWHRLPSAVPARHRCPRLGLGRRPHGGQGRLWSYSQSWMPEQHCGLLHVRWFHHTNEALGTTTTPNHKDPQDRTWYVDQSRQRTGSLP